jgi:hypothetical protein
MTTEANIKNISDTNTMNAGQACVCQICTKKSMKPLVIYSAILFFVIASPFLFTLVNNITTPRGLTILNENGSPNITGLLLHTIVFILILSLSVRFFN